MRKMRATALLVMLAAVVVLPCVLRAADAPAAKGAVEQKIVYVSGMNSKLMVGDEDAPRLAEPGKIAHGVLPRLLKEGWTVVSVHVQREVETKRIAGYIVLQRVKS